MQHEVRPVRYCRTGGSEARKTTAKRPRRSLEAKRSAKGLLAVVPLDPAGNVEGPGVGEKEGPGQEKAVEVLRQRPHLPSPPHTRVSVADPPYVSFHHVRLFQWSEPPQPQMRDPRQSDPSPHSAQRGHGRPKALQRLQVSLTIPTSRPSAAERTLAAGQPITDGDSDICAREHAPFVAF